MKIDHFKNITMQQLEILIKLVESGSFTRAARQVFLTQPTLTKHVKNLEDMIGARVVNRTNAGVSLTSEGRILYDYARKILKLREETKDKIRKVKEHEFGTIFISASTIPSTYILPRLIGQFKKLHPNIHINIQVNDSEETLQMILNDQAEIGFIGKEAYDKKLILEALWKDRMVLVVPRGHLWAGNASITLAQLVKEPFICRERGSGTREVLESYLQKNTDKSLSNFNTVCEMGSSEAVKEGIIAGLGVSILSVHAIGRECKQGIVAVVPVEDFSIERNFFLICKKQFNLMNYHKLFLDLARDYRPVLD